MECGDSVIFLIVTETVSYPHHASLHKLWRRHSSSSISSSSVNSADVLHRVSRHIFINNTSSESYILCIPPLFFVIICSIDLCAQMC